MVHSSTLARLCQSLAALLSPVAVRAGDDAKSVVAALDTEYQAAVERNDWQTMDRILHPEFTLVVGSGKSFSRAELIASARNQDTIYEKQVEMPGTQTVRLFGDDTATVTALLWLKGKRKGQVKDQEHQLRLQTLVHRYLRSDGGRLEIRFRAGITPASLTPTPPRLVALADRARGDAIDE